MPSPIVTVVVPTMAADDALAECLQSLEHQTLDRFEVVVVDNSGASRVSISSPRVRVIANTKNVGFGAAVNQAFRQSEAPYLAILNDDAIAHPDWLSELVAAAEKHPAAGMFASRVLLNEDHLDSAGMLIARDGSSKQRGHGESPALYDQPAETLLPTGSAALYRRKMLDEIDPFDETFFLYCEDTDLGLRAQWAGWSCQYVSSARVEHRYSHSSGRASLLKAYFVERNRLYLIVKNFPLRMLFRAPFASTVRYFWHLIFMIAGRGKAAEFRKAGHAVALLPFLVLRAHFAALMRLPRLLTGRRRIFRNRRISSAQFEELLRRQSISLRQVAAL